MAAQGYRSKIPHDFENIYEEQPLEALERTGDEALQERLVDPLAQEDSGRANDSCDCDAECDKLHVTRLPHNVRVSLTGMNVTQYVSCGVSFACTNRENTSWPNINNWSWCHKLISEVMSVPREYREKINLVSSLGRNVSAKKSEKIHFVDFVFPPMRGI